MANNQIKTKKIIIPWTQDEEDILIKNVRNNVTNLRKAFYQTSLEIQRSEKAITGHWYQHTSKQGDHCLFLTVSGQHVAINRKNGKGQPTTLSFFQKVLAIFGLKY